MAKLMISMKTLLVASTAMVAAGAHAQGAADAGRDGVGDAEIVVTAQKREERLIDVPQSVTAISADSLGKLAATQFRDFANTIPGLSFQTAGAGATQISLRGVTAGTDVSSTVGVYVDEVPYGSSTSFGRNARYTPDGNLYDVARVEVLRGPQGTLYGASSMGGLLKYVSKKPDTDTLAAELQAGVSDTRFGGTNYNGAAAVNVPIATDKAAIRVSGFYAHDAGFIDNPTLGRKNVNRSNVYGARADLLLTPTERLSIRLAAEFQTIKRRGTGEVDYNYGYINAAPLVGQLQQDRAVVEPFEQRFRVVSGTINYDFGGATLTSITSYQETRTKNLFDYTPAGIFGPGLTGLTDQPSTDKFTQELRLATKIGDLVELTVGGFYTHEDGGRDSEIIYAPGGTPIPGIYILSAPSTYKEYAAFGNVTLHLTEKFDVTGGLRFARNEQAYSQIGTGFATTRPTTRSNENVVTYLANARYSFSRHANLYARFATGYRPGGPNFFAAGFPNPPSFDSDKLQSYELGFKGETSDRTFTIDAAIYHIDWKNIQTFDITSPFGGFINGPKAKIDGAEAALIARPAEGLSFTANIAMQDARLAVASAGLNAAKGDRLPNVPRYTVGLSGDYVFPIEAWEPSIGASLRFVADRNSTFSLSPFNHRLPAYTQVDLRAGFTVGPVKTQLYVRNLTDERGQLSAVSVDGLPPRIAVLQPRTIGISGSFKY